MKKLILACLLAVGCGPLPPPPVVIATASVTDYAYNGFLYTYYNDCGPVYYYADGTYDAVCTFTPDGLMAQELAHIGRTLACPGPSYGDTEYVNAGYDEMDYVVDCQ